MAESLGPGMTFAGCRIEGEAGRGGMGVVFRATQLALQRPVALKAIAPELAADAGFRERFQREAHLAASIEHPNVIPVYEAGELDGTLYLLMRWVEGTDLRTLLAHAGRLSPERAIQLLRPVAAALAVAHRSGLVHRDIKAANVLIAHGDVEDDDHVYLTDFGIARRTDVESATRTGVFVGTVDYTAPERFEGGKGDAASDIYSFGCLLFEVLTGHVPYERPSSISKIHAHIADPIPSARVEVPGLPERLDAIIAKAMAKRPEDRFASAGELGAALGRALHPLESAERGALPPQPAPDLANLVAQTATTDDDATHIAPPAAADDVGPTRLASTPADDPGPTSTPADDPGPTRLVPPAADAGPTRLEPAPIASRPPATHPPPPQRPGDDRPPPAPPARRSPLLWLAPLLVLSLAGVLIATFSDVRSDSAQTTTTTSTPTTGSATAPVKLQGGGLRLGRTIALASTPSAVSIGKKNVWTSLPASGQLVRSNLASGRRDNFPATGGPTALAAGFKALWVAQPASKKLAQFNGDAGTQVGATKLPGTPAAVVFDHQDGTAWVADSSGAITHVAVGGAVIGTPARSSPAATSIAWGEGWLWAANGAANGLVRVSLDASGASTAFPTRYHAAAVTTDRGVWVANSNGHVTRFDPTQLKVVADLPVAPELDAIAAIESGPFVWAMSKSRKVVYRITATGTGEVTGKVRFSSPPLALAVNGSSLWVATQDHKLTEIRF